MSLGPCLSQGSCLWVSVCLWVSACLSLSLDPHSFRFVSLGSLNLCLFLSLGSSLTLSLQSSLSVCLSAPLSLECCLSLGLCLSLDPMSVTVSQSPSSTSSLYLSASPLSLSVFVCLSWGSQSFRQHLSATLNLRGPSQPPTSGLSRHGLSPLPISLCLISLHHLPALQAPACSPQALLGQAAPWGRPRPSSSFPVSASRILRGWRGGQY